MEKKKKTETTEATAEALTQETESEVGREQESAEKVAPALLYDTTAPQRVPVLLPLDGETYEIILKLRPVMDVALANYARKCAQVSGDGEEDEEDALAALVGAGFDAAVYLFDQLADGVEGIGEEGEEAPDDWRDIFGAADKTAVIDGAVLVAQDVAPRAAKKGKRPSWGTGLKNSTVRLKVVFDGREVETTHVLKKPDAKVFSDFTTTFRAAYGQGRAGDAHMMKLAALYDRLHIGHGGYASHVPLHHKARAVLAHISQQARSLRKN